MRYKLCNTAYLSLGEMQYVDLHSFLNLLYSCCSSVTSSFGVKHLHNVEITVVLQGLGSRMPGGDLNESRLKFAY